jgi:crotonobetainyl-CoA:carnitine CoA-transferase CaiB-like acyl-CoA transferase
VETPDLWGGFFRAPAPPVRFPGEALAPRGPAPSLGAHTLEVLREAGLGADAIEAVMRTGVAN